MFISIHFYLPGLVLYAGLKSVRLELLTSIFVKHYFWIPPSATKSLTTTKSDKVIFSIKVKVKVTRSLTLVSIKSIICSVCLPNMQSYNISWHKNGFDLDPLTCREIRIAYILMRISVSSLKSMVRSISLLKMHKLWDTNWHLDTVNVVIFAGGKFRENVCKTFHVGVIFTILLIFPS